MNMTPAIAINDIVKCRRTGDLWALSEVIGRKKPKAWFHRVAGPGTWVVPVADISLDFELTNLRYCCRTDQLVERTDPSPSEAAVG